MSDDHPFLADQVPHSLEERNELSSDGGLRISEFLDALAVVRRRYALYYLQNEEYAEVDELAKQVAAWEFETSAEDLAQERIQNVRIDLYHTQLPKLEDTGIIAYDPRCKAVRYHDPPDAVEQFLDYCSMLETPRTNQP